MKYTTVVLLMVAATASPAAAQRPSTSRCAGPDSTQQWFKDQRAWLDESKHDWSDDALRQQLLRAAGVDGTRPVALQLGWEAGGTQPPTDSAAVALLKARGKDRTAQWPTRSVVGPAGVRAVWLLAKRDTSIAATTLKHMMEAGPAESFAADVSVMEDRMRVLAGRGQIYGSQFLPASTVPAYLEDSSHVNLRRDGAMLPPFEQSACAARRSQSR
jgi:hypothetical protein